MPTITETSGSVCLQLELDDEPASSLSPVPATVGRIAPAPKLSVTTRALPPVELSHYIAPGTGGHGRARADALLAITQVFACRVAVFGYDSTRRDKFLIMVGTRPVLDALDLLLPKIALTMEGAARAARRAYAADVQAATPDMTRSERRSILTVPYFRGYLRGFGSGAAEAIRESRSGIIAADADVARIIADQDARAADASNREFPAPLPLRKEKTEHRGAFQAGRDAGLMAGFDEDYVAQHDLVFAVL